MTSEAATGYAMLAAKQLNLAPIIIKALAEEMHYAMDEHTEEEAEEVYRNT